MKISASTYSFNRLLVNGTYNQLSLIGKVKELGFDAMRIGLANLRKYTEEVGL